MTAEIISVGTELLLGNILNTNAQYLSRELAALGITVQRESTIGDNHGRLADFVNEAKQRCDLLVFTGGLGPTADDLTKETVAEAFGDTLHFDEAEWQKIVDFFARTGRGGRTPTANNRKQAVVPTKGHKLPNAHGTAPGAWFEDDGCIAVLMPGVPREMKAMWAEDIRPVLLQRQNCTIHSKTLRVLGGESSIASKVSPLFASENPTAAIYCKTGESEIRVTARAATEAEAETACDARIAEFRKILGPNAYDVDVPGLEYTVVHLLQQKGLHAATAESCTGGLVAEKITNVPGSSEVFGYGFVTYAEAAKAKLLGVDPTLIEQYNVVSGPVAVAMAYGALQASGADLAVGITGIAGPGGALPGKPVGTVYLAGADARSGKAWLMRLELGGYAEDQHFTGINGGSTVTTGFGHGTVLSVADKVIDAVKAGAIKHFFLVGGCDGARPGRNYYTEFVKQTPADTVVLTLACGKYRFNDLDLGTIGGLPRIMDMGQCNDAYSAIQVAVALAKAFDCGVNDLPLTLVLSWYEQKAVCILLTLLSLGIKNIYLGPTLPAFVSKNVLNYLVENFNITPTSTPEADLKKILG